LTGDGENRTGTEGEEGPTLEAKDYLALVIAALETVLLPLVIAIVVIFVLLLVLR